MSCSKDQVKAPLEGEVGEGDENPIEEEDNPIEEEEVLNSSTFLFTDQAKAELRRRIENGYSAGSGFLNDFSSISSEVTSFMNDPDQYRAHFGEFEVIPVEGGSLHRSALYAYALDDVNVANAIATEILGTFNDNSLTTNFWLNTAANSHWGNEYSLFVQSAKVKKLKDSYYLIKNLQDVLTTSEKNTIAQWFSDYKDLAYAWAFERFNTLWGTGWETNGFSTFHHEEIYHDTPGLSTPYPIENSDGSVNYDYVMTLAQDAFSNRILDHMSYLHSWAVTNDDINLQIFCREYFKNAIRYAVFSDGTFWELIRNTNSYNDNTLGVFYTNVTLTGFVYMAHIDAMSNNFPNDRLYDFETTDGILEGSTTITTNPYPGSSTTDGVTLKSLKTVLKAQSNYLRSSANGGWNDTRYYDGAPMSTVGKRQNSVLAAIANLYYKDQDLKDYYLYNTSVGYPVKVPIGEGWGGNEDYGAWQNLIVGSAWFEQENNFFN